MAAARPGWAPISLQGRERDRCRILAEGRWFKSRLEYQPQFFASTLTQPFDTVKTRLQVGAQNGCASVLWNGGQKALRERGSCVFLERDIAARCTHGCVGHCIVFCV